MRLSIACGHGKAANSQSIHNPGMPPCHTQGVVEIKVKNIKGTADILAAMAALLMTACSPSFKVPEMTPEETSRLEALTQRMTTRCVGRYLIDLPEDFVLNPANPVTVEGIPIKVTPMTRGLFEYQLQERERELRSEHMDGKPDRPLLKSMEPVTDGFVGRVFNRVESGGTAEFGRVLELLGWKNGYRIDMEIKATDGVGTPEEHESWMKDFPTDTPQKLALLQSLYERVHGRAENTIPTDKGLCIANGFISGPAIEEEGLSMAFDLKGSPDVYFMLQEHGDLHEEKSLLERSGQVEKEMKESGTQTIRKGKKDISGHPFEEWLWHGPTPDRVQGTMFALHGNEVAKGADKPFVIFELFNGFRVLQSSDLSDEQKERLGLYKDLEKATLSPAAALALWDKIIPTLRRRPGAF